MGSVRRTTAFSSENIAVFAAIPSASVITTAAVKPGDFDERADGVSEILQERTEHQELCLIERARDEAGAITRKICAEMIRSAVSGLLRLDIVKRRCHARGSRPWVTQFPQRSDFPIEEDRVIGIGPVQ